MPKYEYVRGMIHWGNRQFFCPCGNGEFRVEIGSDPLKYWCDCGAWYTEFIVDRMKRVFPDGS